MYIVCTLQCLYTTLSVSYSVLWVQHSASYGQLDMQLGALHFNIKDILTLIFIYDMILGRQNHFALFLAYTLSRVSVIFQQAPKIFLFNCSQLFHSETTDVKFANVKGLLYPSLFFRHTAQDRAACLHVLPLYNSLFRKSCCNSATSHGAISKHYFTLKAGLNPFKPHASLLEIVAGWGHFSSWFIGHRPHDHGGVVFVSPHQLLHHH